MLERKNKIVFKPNNQYSAGVRIHIFGIGLEVTTSIPFARKNAERYGETDVFDLAFNSVGEKWITEFGHHRYTGFYLKPSWLALKRKEDVFPQRPDLEVKSTGLSTMYIFNHRRFSEAAPYLFTEHQANSSGSFLMGFTYAKFKISSPTAIISNEYQGHYETGADARFMDFESISFMPGYSHTFVHKNFFLNLTAQAGPAHYWVNFRPVGGGNHYDIDINLAYAFRVGLGYNGDNFFYGITYNARNSRSEVLETRFSASASTFRILAGLRIMEKGIFVKRLKDLEKVILKK
jgi:hypothetical protein